MLSGACDTCPRRQAGLCPAARQEAENPAREYPPVQQCRDPKTAPARDVLTAAGRKHRPVTILPFLRNPMETHMNFARKFAAILAVLSVVTPSLAAEAASDPGSVYFALVTASFERAGMRRPGTDTSGEGYAALIRASFERQEMAVAPAPSLRETCRPGS